MRITIEPTETTLPLPGVTTAHITVTVEHPDDDLDACAVVDLMRSAMLAWGFLPDTINNYLVDHER